MNPKVFVGVAIGAVLVAIVLVVTSGSVLLEGFIPSGQPATVVPVNVNVDEVSTISLNQNGATLEIIITISNPNPKAAILSLVKYQIYQNDVRVAAGEIGERSGGMVDASDYYTILSNGNVVLRDRIELVNTGGAPEFWSALASGEITWVVTGEAFFNLSSMTSGQENVILFEQVLG
ncbi:MAG: hypothetical protein F4W68_02980 [Cenarchaeum sp. SB0661_bin_35]|nr:hypothetical protein [Cenarchaeum sp. SB0667_bin_13]MYC79450.1 hypothetical protein [Cenarchaeum sp. SB0661_bin_35]